MNYELAKKLKVAGFPQRSEKSWIFSKRGLSIKDTPSKKQKRQMDLVGVDVVSAPSLSELIYRCGDKFWSLIIGWTAQDISATHFGDGLTPEEAVASLWLELNKK